MKRVILFGSLLFVVLFCLFFSLVSHAADVPTLKGRVNDYAGIMSADAVKQTDAVSKNLETTDSTQLAVLTVASLQGEDIRDFGLKVARTWKLGQKTTSTKTYDNGILIVISMNPKKWGVEVGRGLEGKLTDVKSKEIMQEYFVPLAKKGDFGGGIAAAANVMAKTVRGEFTSPKR